MTSRAAAAAVGFALMLAVVAAYIVLAQRVRVLWHPLAIVAAVLIVSVVVTVLGELIFRGGWPGVPAMLRRSAIGGFAWGLVTAVVVSLGRRGLAAWMAKKHPS